MSQFFLLLHKDVLVGLKEMGRSEYIRRDVRKLRWHCTSTRMSKCSTCSVGFLWIAKDSCDLKLRLASPGRYWRRKPIYPPWSGPFHTDWSATSMWSLFMSWRHIYLQYQYGPSSDPFRDPSQTIQHVRLLGMGNAFKWSIIHILLEHFLLALNNKKVTLHLCNCREDNGQPSTESKQTNEPALEKRPGLIKCHTVITIFQFWVKLFFLRVGINELLMLLFNDINITRASRRQQRSFMLPDNCTESIILQKNKEMRHYRRHWIWDLIHFIPLSNNSILAEALSYLLVTSFARRGDVVVSHLCNHAKNENPLFMKRILDWYNFQQLSSILTTSSLHYPADWLPTPTEGPYDQQPESKSLADEGENAE